MQRVCTDCGGTYPSDGPWRCACGSPLDLQGLPELPAEPPALDRDAGLWACEDFLPVEPHVTLGEGWTPLIDAKEDGVTYKLEHLFPTGSFKDRGAAVVISHALERGADRVLEDSSGNAGLAIATYAACTGIDAEIFVPADAKPGKLRAIERTGAALRQVDGDREAVTQACTEVVEAGEGYYASHAWEPLFLAGTATFALEVAAQRDWEAPDAVVTPLGHGTLFLGAAWGFDRLQRAGWIDDVPRLFGVQASGVAPIAAARGNDRDAGRNDLADGIQIAEPVRREGILDAIERSDGDAIAVTAGETEQAHDRLAARGLAVEPTSATAVAGLNRLRERGVVDESDEVVVPLTGQN
ncbi:Threonine synthase protein [Halorhabdus tiamatea SARL4B]|uniref:Threonine synthase n=1 Tax=Halorhabdus tiamatea SARL4B TaxID=1033806 RepID=F7PQG4_9EURY|nr:pyridoxal-phosphate dependent enzyme [Halorhabdus tiamatea]ERJ06072.1 Threonine synthase protein [Halorhabdus tiamatea SARL4B]CCQ33298.1 threonine synthase [Halorhabdus tiamatea SARL4B]